MSDIEERIAAVMIEHQRVYGIRDLHKHCTCGWFSKVLADDFPAHQAAVLAGLVREAQAEAWEEGRDVEFQRSVMKRQVDPNPSYRIEDGK